MKLLHGCTLRGANLSVDEPSQRNKLVGFTQDGVRDSESGPHGNLRIVFGSMAATGFRLIESHVQVLHERAEGAHVEDAVRESLGNSRHVDPQEGEIEVGGEARKNEGLALSIVLVQLNQKHLLGFG